MPKKLLLQILFAFIGNFVNAQCTVTNATALPTTAQNPGTITSQAGKYIILNTTAGHIYTIGSNLSTQNFNIREGTYNGSIVAQGGMSLTNPMRYVAQTTGTAYIHISTQACGSSGTSRTITITDVTSACPALTLPITQGFNATSTPSCWNAYAFNMGTSNGGEATISFLASSSSSTASPQEGADFVKFNSFSCDATASARLVSPTINTTGTSSVDIQFYMGHDNNYSTALDNIQVQYSLDGNTWINAGSAINRYSASAGATNSWTQHTVTLPAAAGNVAKVFVGFLFTSQYGANEYLDNVVIHATPPPTISSVSSSVACGLSTVLTINGSDLSNATVSVGGTNITPLTTNTGTQITATISSAVSGVVSVTTASGTANSSSITFSIPPTISQTVSNATICSGQTTNLNVTSPSDPNYTYTWTPGTLTGALQTVSPTTTTIYTINASDAAGCTKTATILVTVNPTPMGATANASVSSICSGNTFNLTSTSNNSPTIVSEGFESGLNGWTIVDSSSTGSAISSQIFQIINAPLTDASGSATFSNFSISGTKFIMANADAGGSGSQTRTFIVSPSFSTVGYTGTGTLTFNHGYRYYSVSSPTEQVMVQISSDGGTTWTTLNDYSGTSVGTTTNNAQTTVTASLTVPAAFMGQANVKLRYRYLSNWGFYWVIDDVNLTGTPLTNTYAWSSTPNTYSSTIQNPTGVVSGTATTDYQVTVSNSFGCTMTSIAHVVVNQPTAPTTIGTYTNTFNHTDGLTKTYTDASCNLIATITDAVGGNVLGNTTTTDDLATSVNSTLNANYIYGRRSYTVAPTTNGPATFTLYYTQADFDNYNANNGTANDLPTGPSDATGIANFRFAKHMTTPVTGVFYLNPASISLTWDATNSYWVASFPTNYVGATYYFTSEATCTVTPTGLSTANITGASATLNWNTISGATWYEIQYKETALSTWTTISSATNSVTIAGLTPATSYDYQVRMYCAGSTTPSSWATSTFTSGSACANPTLNTATPYITSASLSWTAGYTWYSIRYKVNGTSTWTNTSSSGASINLTGLTASTTYDYEVKAWCAPGNVGSNWVAGSFTTAASCVAPTLGSTSNYGNSTTLNWTASSNWYAIQYKESTSSTWLNTTSGGTTVTLYNLTSSVAYDYQVSGYCGSAQSAWVAGTFTSGAPSRQINLTNPKAINSDAIQIYPNPTSGELNIDYRVEQASVTNIKVMDMSGRVVKQIQSEAIEGLNKIQLSLTDLTSGIYTVEIINNDKLINVSRVRKD